MAPRSLALGHVRSTEVQLGGERVVGATMQGQVCGVVRTSLAEGLSMVELEVMRLAAAFAALVDIGATSVVALVDSSAHCGRDVPAVSAFIGLKA